MSKDTKASAPEEPEEPQFTKSTEPIHEMVQLSEGLSLRHRKTIELTTAYAEQHLELPNFVGDRSVEENHVLFLARQMDGGTFRWEQVQLITCTFNGTLYGMNGRHTCWARSYADPAKIKEMYKNRTPVQILHYDAKSEQDLRQLYATTDRGKPRNRGNVVVSYLAGREEFPDFNASTLRNIASGVSYWLWEDGVARRIHTADEVSYLMLTTHHKMSVQLGNFMKTWKSAEHKHVMRQPVTGALCATFAKAPQISLDFWNVVLDGVGVKSKKDPHYVLRNWLMTSSLSLHVADASIRRVSAETMYRNCLTSWNNFRQGKEQGPYRATDKRPEVK